MPLRGEAGGFPDDTSARRQLGVTQEQLKSGDIVISTTSEKRVVMLGLFDVLKGYSDNEIKGLEVLTKSHYEGAKRIAIECLTSDPEVRALYPERSLIEMGLEEMLGTEALRALTIPVQDRFYRGIEAKAKFYLDRREQRRKVTGAKTSL